MARNNDGLLDAQGDLPTGTTPVAVRTTVVRQMNDVAFATYPRTAPDVAGDRAIFVKDNRGMRRVFLRDMLYVEAAGNYVELVLLNGRVVLRNSMAEVLKALPPDVFFMVNRSQAVNILLVDHIGTDDVAIGKVGFTLSRRYRDELVGQLPIITGR